MKKVLPLACTLIFGLINFLNITHASDSPPIFNESLASLPPSQVRGEQQILTKSLNACPTPAAGTSSTSPVFNDSLATLAPARRDDDLVTLLRGDMQAGPAFIKPGWLPLKKDGTYDSSLLTEPQRDALLRKLGVEEGTLNAEETTRLKEGLEAAFHAKGEKYPSLTLEDAAALFETKTGHGALFEQKVADFLNTQGYKVKFTRVGNAGLDLVALKKGARPIKPVFVQVKATANASKSAEQGLMDALEFAGKEKAADRRIADLLSGKNAYELYIPQNQRQELIRDGKLMEDGTPSESLIKSVLQKAPKLTKNTERISAALPRGDEILAKVKIEAGPVTYDELLSDTRALPSLVRSVLGRAADAASGTVLNPTKRGRTTMKAADATETADRVEGTASLTDTSATVEEGAAAAEETSAATAAETTAGAAAEEAGGAAFGDAVLDAILAALAL